MHPLLNPRTRSLEVIGLVMKNNIPNIMPWRVFKMIVACWLLCVLSPIAKAFAAAEIIEKLVAVSGRMLDPAAHAAARETLEAGLRKYGDAAAVASSRGGIGLLEAAALHGEEVWKLSRLWEGASEALATRAETILEVSGRWGRDAACLEMKAPGCGDVLARSLGAAELGELVSKAPPEALKRLAMLASHGSPAEARAAASLWKQGHLRILEHLSPARIATFGFSAAALLAAVQAPSEAIHFLESALTATLGSTLTVISWVLVLVVLAFLVFPALWVIQRLGRVLRVDGQGSGDRNVS